MARTSRTVHIRIQGKRQLQAAFAELGPIASRALSIALTDEANEILEESLDLVPYDTGSLSDTGVVVKATPTDLEAVIVYGDNHVDYAAAVHERLDVYHAPPTQAKFLEDPVSAHTRGLARRLAFKMIKYQNITGWAKHQRLKTRAYGGINRGAYE